MAFKQLSKIDSRTKDTVNGWIRNEETLLKLSNIPSIIKAMSILYYREFEVFHKDLVHEKLQVDDQNKVITNTNRCVGSAFGGNIVIKGRKYHWRIKVQKISNADKYGQRVNIGIIEADKVKGNLNQGWWNLSCGYSYYSGGRLYHGCQISGQAYGTAIKSGDIMDVWLDLKDNNTLSYAKNGENYGVAFQIPSHKAYRFALGLEDAEVIMQMFEVIYK